MTYKMTLLWQNAQFSRSGFKSLWDGLQEMLDRNLMHEDTYKWKDLPSNEVAVIIADESKNNIIMEAGMLSVLGERWKPAPKVKSNHFKRLEQYQPKIVQTMREWNRIIIPTLKNVDGSVLVIGIIRDGKRLYLRDASCWGPEPTSDPMEATNYAEFADDELQEMWKDMACGYIKDKGGAKSGFRSDVEPVAYVFGPEVQDDNSTKIVPFVSAILPKSTG